MVKLIFTIFLFSFAAFSQPISNPKIKPVECRVSKPKGIRSEVRIFTLHDNYSLIIYFGSLNAFLLADHMGNASMPGEGYRYVLFVKDQKIGGFVQGASSSITKTSLSLQDITFEDQKYGLRVRCKGR